MLDSLEIARKALKRPVEEIAAGIGIGPDALVKYGTYKAKVLLERARGSDAEMTGRLVLVTAMTPTPAGVGKTTTSIGLADALNRIGEEAIVALREPSLGPVFGMKGGATGGGYAQVVPSDEINLHFTGDLHAITSAHNLLSAMIDNRIHFDGACGLLDCRYVYWPRVLDMDDRVLRDVVVGIGGPLRGIARESGFDITAASEVMAIFCLARDLADLKRRLGGILVGLSPDGKPVFARDLKAHGAMTALLKDAIRPNLVQTLEGTPALIHGGPFANIAHGTSSVIAARSALCMAPWVVTEAGFGSDLGAEKFFDIVVRGGSVPVPAACVLVATVRALKMHGGVPLEEAAREDVGALEAGFPNLAKHHENMKAFGVPVVVALNRFPSDTEGEIARFTRLCEKAGMRVALSDVYARGGKGGEDLARAVVRAAAEEASDLRLPYPDEMPIVEKVEAVATRIYGAARVAMEGGTRRRIGSFEEQGFGRLPVCIAKTQYSLTSDRRELGRPEGFTLIVTDARLSAGAGFVVIYCGDIMTMPGLPRTPSAERVDVDERGEIVGLS